MNKQEKLDYIARCRSLIEDLSEDELVAHVVRVYDDGPNNSWKRTYLANAVGIGVDGARERIRLLSGEVLRDRILADLEKKKNSLETNFLLEHCPRLDAYLIALGNN